MPSISMVMKKNKEIGWYLDGDVCTSRNNAVEREIAQRTKVRLEQVRSSSPAENVTIFLTNEN